jgi:hypothetical protein
LAVFTPVFGRAVEVVGEHLAPAGRRGRDGRTRLWYGRHRSGQQREHGHTSKEQPWPTGRPAGCRAGRRDLIDSHQDMPLLMARQSATGWPAAIG